MTAEVAVMNKWGVALAADSKVTISHQNGAKGYDGVNKLFALSKSHPVGIMVYGNAEFMRIPWEVLIKEFRYKAPVRNFDLLENWSDSFWDFISRLDLIDDEAQKKNLADVVRAELIEVLAEAKMFASQKTFEFGSDAFVDAMKSHIQHRLDERLEMDSWLAAEDFNKFSQRYSETYLAAISASLGSFQNEILVEVCLKYTLISLVSSQLSPRQSGIVFAGYGEKEFFPTLIEYGTDGYIGESIKRVELAKVDLSRDNASCIKAFAQSDMVHRFMSGIDVSLFDAISNAFYQVLRGAMCDTATRAGQSDKHFLDDLNGRAETAAKELVDSISNYIEEHYSSPIVDMVGMLPKEELAGLAEALVSLTSLKRRVSSDLETVGGPVDVALISKRDGFIWIKRKHYFSKDLNHHFFRNYFGSPQDES